MTIRLARTPIFAVLALGAMAFLLGLIPSRLPGLAAEPPKAETPAFTPSHLAFYEKEVAPVLRQHCLKCHGAEAKVKGGLNLTTRKGTLDGGDTGPAFDAKNPAASRILTAIGYKDDACRMPPKGKLPDREIAVLTKWVMDGLAFPADKLGGDTTTAKTPAKGGVVTEEARRYWAYQPVKRPPVPASPQPKASTHPIDAFIRAKLDAKGLKPVGPADKVALVRRAYYDLWGLPPSPEEVDAFVKDTAPDAWEKLLDKLLASSHYGEKWGRHWLDVVRFAESNGYERDGPKPFAWKYRDYVIRSFNADKPYDQFVKEQIAGDEMPGFHPDAIIATGYYRLGVWDDEPADPLLAMYDGYDDLVTVTGQAFLGMTLNCARCHDHKVDPIPQSDYYKLVAFFRDIRPFSDTRGTSSSNNITDITSPDRRKTYEAELRERQAKIDELTRNMTGIENAAIRNMPAVDQRAAEGAGRPGVLKKVPGFLSAREKAEYLAMKDERAGLERKPRPPGQEFALSVNNCDVRPPAVHVLTRGNPRAPAKEVKPGFPEVLGAPEPVIPAPASGARTSGRRTALANWIARPDNPLTARVMVNRLWQHHFGKGLVPSSNDFGKLGEPCTHPELLDWLAAEFVSRSVNGGREPAVPWTLKRMHKLIMTSAAYQRASIGDAANLKADPANALLWRFNMRRLTAEEVRDSMLLAGGRLNLTPFGPSAFPKIPDAVLAGQSVPGNGWLASKRPKGTGGYDPANPDAGNRRSVYVYVKRSLQVPILITHDQADTDGTCPVRYTTTVPTQALGLLNGEFATESATAFARRLMKESPNNFPAQVIRAIRLTTGRVPSTEEVNKDVAFIRSMKEQHALDDFDALTRYTLLLLNTNEFVYLD